MAWPAPSPILPLTLLALSWASVAAAAQDGGGGTALGLIRTASGRPVAAATVRWIPRATDRPAWIPVPADGLPVADESDARGRFRFAVPPGPAICVVTTASGLGAVVPDAAAGQPLPITVRPMASVRFADGRTWAGRRRLVTGPGETVELPRFETDTLTLPAGPWLFWIETGDLAFEWTRTLHEGQTVEIVAPRRHQPGWTFDQDLLAIGSGRWPPDPDRREPRLAQLAAPDSVLAWVGTAEACALIRGWFAGGAARQVELEATPLRWSTRELDPAAIPVEAGARRGEAWTVVAEPAGPRAIARGSVRLDAARPALSFARPIEGRAAVILRGDGLASRVLTAAELDGDAPISLRAAAVATGRVVAADGAAVAGAAVRVLRSDPLLDATLYTDARGRFRIPDLAAGEPFRLRIDDARHLPAERDATATAGATELGTIPLAAGAELSGVVRDGDGRALPDVAVELRDASGGGELSARRAISGADGGFRFAGLPRAGLFVLFATTERNGHTWSGKVARAFPGPDEWTVTVRDEDPTGPGSRGGSGRR